MTYRSSLNKSKLILTLSPEKLEIERKLLPRLRLMGYIFFVLALSAFIFILTFEEELPSAESQLETTASLLIEEEALLESNPTEVFNFYLVSLLFASLGSLCLFIEKKKKRDLKEEIPPHMQ
jgi:hypothetical protein